MTLTIVTTTRNRPLCFALLEEIIARQTLQPDQWLVVNDGLEPYSYTRGQEVIRRKPKKTMKKPDGSKIDEISILANWQAAFPKIRSEKIVVIEDDDWYHPTYLETMSLLLNQSCVCGVANDSYYKLRSRRWQRMYNVNHASFAATGFRSWATFAVERAVNVLCTNNRSVFVDMYLWAEAQPMHDLRTKLIDNKADDGRALHVGMKQMPGAAGLGMGHTDQGTPDPAWSQLTAWVGPDDCRLYRSIPKTAWGSSG